MGFQLILYPLAALFAAAKAMEIVAQKLRDDGTTVGVAQEQMTFEEFNGLIGVEEKYALAQRYGVE